MALAWVCAGLLGAAPAGAGHAPASQSGRSEIIGKSAHGLPPPALNTPFYGALSWTGETVSNLSGGMKTGTRADSLLHVGVAANSDALGLPPGGRLKISAIRIDSGQPSVNLVGDAQVVSNIAAPSATRVYQLWYRHDFASKRLRLRAGWIDLNQYFDVLESAADLLNSSFGISPGISANMASSIFPEPGLGAMARWKGDGSALSLGLFQGDPSRRYELENGHSIIAEWQPVGYKGPPDSTQVKLGLWEWRGSTGDPADGTTQTWGAYGSLQIPAGWPDAILFAHLASSPGPRSPAPFSAALGISADSPLRGRLGGRISLGMTLQGIRGAAAETALEATYALPLTDNVVIQPDLQYVIDPGGAYANSLVFALRLHVALETHFQGRPK